MDNTMNDPHTPRRQFRPGDIARTGQWVWVRAGARALFSGELLTPGWRRLAANGPTLIGDLTLEPTPGKHTLEYVRSRDCELAEPSGRPGG